MSMKFHWSEMDQKFWIPTDDGPLWFESALEAKDAMREMEIDAAAKAERDRIAAWLRSLTEVNVGQFVGTLQYLADNIEAGEHLK